MVTKPTDSFWCPSLNLVSHILIPSFPEPLLPREGEHGQHCYPLLWAGTVLSTWHASLSSPLHPTTTYWMKATITPTLHVWDWRLCEIKWPAHSPQILSGREGTWIQSHLRVHLLSPRPHCLPETGSFGFSVSFLITTVQPLASHIHTAALPLLPDSSVVFPLPIHFCSSSKTESPMLLRGFFSYQPIFQFHADAN